MIRRSVLVVAALILLFIVPSCNGDNGTAPDARATGTIQGDVFDVTADEPLAGATVRVTSEPFAVLPESADTVEMTETTGTDGQFNLVGVPSGFITVVVSKEGYKTPDSQTWALVPGGVGDFTFEMAPGEDPVPEFEGDEQVARPPDWGETPED